MTNVSLKAMATPLLSHETLATVSKNAIQGVGFADFFSKEILAKTNVVVQVIEATERDNGDKAADSANEIINLEIVPDEEEASSPFPTNDEFSKKVLPNIDMVPLRQEPIEKVSVVMEGSGKAGSEGEIDGAVFIQNLQAAISVNEVENEVARRPDIELSVPTTLSRRTSEPSLTTIPQKSAVPTPPVPMGDGSFVDVKLVTKASENPSLQPDTSAKPYRMGSSGPVMEAHWAEGKLGEFPRTGGAVVEREAQQVKIPIDKLEPVGSSGRIGLEAVPVKGEAKVLDSHIPPELGKLAQRKSIANDASQDVHPAIADVKNRAKTQASGNFDRGFGSSTDTSNSERSNREHDIKTLSNTALKDPNSGSLLSAPSILSSKPQVQSADEALANSHFVAAPVLNSNKLGRDRTELVDSAPKSDGIETVKAEIPARQDLNPLAVSQAVVNQSKPLSNTPIVLEGQTKSLKQAGEGGQHSEVFGVVDRMSNSSQISAPHDLKTQQTAQLASSVGHQIAIEVHKTQGGTTEIALNPEELGRVSLTMKAVEGSVTLVISAERPETQDLMRRHIETLAQEFRDLGYSDVNLSFQDHGQGNRNGTENRGSERATGADIEPAEIDKPKVKSNGLDLRL